MFGGSGWWLLVGLGAFLRVRLVVCAVVGFRFGRFALDL